MFALDTNMVVAALNATPRVVEKLAAIAPSAILIPDPVIAELLFGARSSARVAANVAKVERLVAAFRTAPFDTAVARRFAEVKAHLRRSGRTKQDFDVAIACVAMEQGATLVTHDGDLHDGAIPSLVVEDWLA